jgi:hypothetical protein
MVDNIHEIEPVVKREAALPATDNEEEKPQLLPHEDPAQMKLEL